MQKKFVLVRSRIRQHPLGWVGLLLCAVGFLLVGAVGTTQAAEPWTVSVTGTSDGEPDEVDLAGLTFDDAHDALTQASTDAAPVVLPVAPTGFPGVTTDDATLDVDESTHALTVSGPTTLLGVPAEVIVVATWADASSDDSPSVTVAFRTGAASLSDFAPSLDAVDVGLSATWTAFRRDASDTSDLVVGDLPQAGQDFFDDGDPDNDDDLAIGQGVAFRGLVDGSSAGLGDALGRVGVDYARLDGTLSTSDEALEDGAAAPTGFALTATLGASSPASMPEWLELGSSWTLDLATSGGDLTVGLAGDATVTLGDTALDVSASVAVTSAGGALSVDLALELDTVEAPFGADWLTLESASLTASISGDSVAGALSAEVTVGEGADAITGSVEIALERTAGAVSATVDASLDGTISAFDLAELVGADISGLPDDVDVTLSDLALHVGVDGSTTPKTLTVSATGEANVELGGSSIGATMLVRSGPDGVIVAARPSGELSLSDFVGTVTPDPVLPDLSVVVSTADVDAASADLDEPTRRYFAGVLCPDADQDCDFDLELDQGVALAAAIELPEALTDPLAEIGLDVDGPLKVSGLIPAFGGTTTELRVELPGLTAAGDGEYVRGAGLDLFIRKTGSDVTFGLKGTLTLGIPRVESDDCPSGIYIGGGSQCIDEIEFSLAAQFSFDGTSSSFELVGGLASAADAGWQRPFGIPYLTLHEAKLKLGVTTGPTTSVDIGFLGSLVVGQTDISISALIGITPNAPYLDFKGFTGSSMNGLSMRQLGKLYTEVSGQVIPESIIPPVGIRNLFLSIGHVDDADLCLRQGFYLSGDLYLDKGAPNGDITPACLPPGGDEPSVTDQCEEDSDCLASVLVDVQTGKGGGLPSVNAQGYITGWSAGPLTFDPTIVKLNLNSSGARVFIKAGAALLDPIAYYTDPGSAGLWASGQVTLDIGTQRLLVKGDVVIADILEAGFSGSGKFDLTDPDFEISVYLRAAFLDDIAAGIDEAIRAVNAASDEFAQAFSSQNVEKVFTEIRTAFADLGNPGSATWQTLSTGYFDFRDKVDDANDTLETFGFGRPIPVNQILDLALHGIVTPDIPEVEVCIIKCFTLIPSINIPDIPGMCSYTPGLMGTPICTGPKDQVDEQLRAQYAAPVIKSEVADAGLALPAGVSVDTLVNKFAALQPTSTPASKSAQLVASGGTDIACAVSQISYPSGDISDTTFDVQTMGTVVTITGDEPSELATASGPTAETADEAEQDTFNALLTTSDAGGCTGSTPPPGPTKVLTLALDKSLVDEGSQLVASGRSVGGTAGQPVTVRWGDGTTSTTTLAADLKWQASHTYADDAGPGMATTYTVRAEAPDHSEAIRQVGIVNVSPLIADLVMPSATVDETAVSTVTGRVVDPGTLDTHTLVVDWGDGTAPETVPVVAGAFTSTHHYADDNPSATDRDVMPISVEVTDKDRASTDESGTLTVLNTAAFGVTFGATTNALVDGTTTFVRADRPVTWVGTASDRSVVDPLLVDVDWGDGTGTDIQLTNNGTIQRLLQAEHGWTQPCVYRVSADVTDDDLGAAGTVGRTVVVTRPTADKRVGTAFWTKQFKDLEAGRKAALTPAQASCYLAVARHVSTTFQRKVRLTSVAEATDILTLNRPEPGQTRPSSQQAKLIVQRAKLDRALLSALLDFVHGRRAWDARVVVRPGSSVVRFGQLVARADQARASRSVEQVMALRRSLSML